MARTKDRRWTADGRGLRVAGCGVRVAGEAVASVVTQHFPLPTAALTALGFLRCGEPTLVRRAGGCESRAVSVAVGSGQSRVAHLRRVPGAAAQDDMSSRAQRGICFSRAFAESRSF